MAQETTPDGAIIEDVAFKAATDGTEQRYVLLTPPRFDATRPCDILIALHGHGSDRWQFVRDGRDECRAARDFAARHGMLFVSPDYRACTSWMGPRAEADVLQIITGLKASRRIARVFVCGGSMGGTSALVLAVRHPELPAGVAAMNGTANLVEYENFQDAIRESYGGTKEEVPGVYRERSAELRPERLTMPVGLTAGGRDASVPPQSVLRLARTLEERVGRIRLVYREDGGHATNYEDATAILDFMLA